MPRPRKTLPDETVAAVLRLKAEGRNRTAIAAELGISERQVRAALDGSRAAPALPQAAPARSPVWDALVGRVSTAGKRTKADRYPKRPMQSGPRMVVDGQDLGPAMLPQDILRQLMHAYELADKDIAEALALGADRLQHLGPDDPIAASMGIPIRERAAAAAAALRITPSGVQAWRRRQRQMTWREFRVLLLGLKDLELGPREGTP